MSDALCASIAGIELRFAADNPAVRTMLERRLGRFARPLLGEAPIDVELDLRGTDPAVVNDGAPLALSQSAGGSLELVADNARAVVSPDNRHATLTGELAAGPVDGLLRLLLARALLRRDALLLHAAAVEVETGALVAVGPSGSGKSTLGRHLPGRRFCDEAVVVAATGVVESTPFWDGQPASADLAGLICLQRAQRSSWVALSPSQAAGQLVASCGPLPPDGLDDALRVAARIAECAPFRSRVSLADIDAIETWLPQRLAEARA